MSVKIQYILSADLSPYIVAVPYCGLSNIYEVIHIVAHFVPSLTQ